MSRKSNKKKKSNIKKSVNTKKNAQNVDTIRTSMYNEKPELLKLACKNCGATLKLVDKTHAKCQYCGQEFLIDEATGVVIGVTIDYGDSLETRNIVRSIRKILIAFCLVAAVVVGIIVSYNMEARDSDSVWTMFEDNNDEEYELIKVFCEDIFDKKYKQITDAEFAQIRYLNCAYVHEDGEWLKRFYYSFTNYEDCATEEEFSETIQCWSNSDEYIDWPTDYTMFAGLTRIISNNELDIVKVSFSKDAHISYVETCETINTVGAALRASDIKVLHLTNDCTTLKGIEDFTNLQKIKVDYVPSDSAVDVGRLASCTKLNSIYIYGNGHFQGAEELGVLKELESLYIDNIELPDCDFIRELTKLKELKIATGSDPDLTILSELPNLERLYLTDRMDIPSSELVKLANLQKLEELQIEIESKDGIDILAGFTNLKKLYLAASVFPLDKTLDLSPLCKLTKLEHFSFTSAWCNISGIEQILNQPSLRSMYISTSMYEAIRIYISPDTLVDRPEITRLYFNNCSIYDAETKDEIGFECLKHYKGVRDLTINECGLTDISFMSELKELRVCSLRENEITDFSPLKSCQKLEEVDVYSNFCEEIDLPEDVIIKDSY